MKTIRTFAAITLCLGFFLSSTSCFIVLKKDNGKHKGWFKNPNNPHHNPGKSNGKGKGK